MQLNKDKRILEANKIVFILMCADFKEEKNFPDKLKSPISNINPITVRYTTISNEIILK